MYCYFSFCLYAYYIFFFCFLLENKCKFAAYNWLQIWCINTLLLINFGLFLLFLFVTSYNLQTSNVLCSFIISVWLILNVRSFVFLYVFYLVFLLFHKSKFVSKSNIIITTIKNNNNMIIVFRSFFYEGKKCYPQVFFEKCLCKWSAADDLLFGNL